MAKHRKFINNWAPIMGLWQSEGTEITYLEPDPRSHFGFGIAITSLPFRNGTISATVNFHEGSTDNEARLVFGYNPQSRNYYSAGLGGYGNAYVIDEYIEGRGWQALAVAGSKQNITSSEPYRIIVRVQGQHVSLQSGDITVVETSLPRPLYGNQLGLLSVGPGPVTFSSIAADAHAPQVFVVMQYGEPYDSIYTEVIKPVCEKMYLAVLRADDLHKPGIILSDIIISILESEVIVAEVSPANPNVYYELGYAHALSKNTILLAERDKDLPFDLSSYRCIFYDNTIRGKRDVDATLRNHLENIFEK